MLETGGGSHCDGILQNIVKDIKSIDTIYHITSISGLVVVSKPVKFTIRYLTYMIQKSAVASHMSSHRQAPGSIPG
jgi:hypothetical protein